MHTYSHAHAYIHAHTYVHTDRHTYIHIYTYLHTCRQTDMCISIYICSDSSFGSSFFRTAEHIVAIMDYRKANLQKRNQKGTFVGNRLTSAHMVGKLLESCFMVVFSPSKKRLPQAPATVTSGDHSDSITFVDTLVSGEAHARSVAVAARLEDKELAIKMFRQVLGKLQGRPLFLQIHSVDHVCSAAAFNGSHDLLASPFPGLDSRLSPGVYSVELRCREIVERQPRTFNWQDTLEEEALPLLTAELNRDTTALKGRMLILVEMNKPCHGGSFSVHGSLYATGGPRWTNLFGWSGFKRTRQEQPGAANSRQEQPRASSQEQPRAPRPTRAAEWLQVVPKLRAASGWVVLSRFLKEVNKPSNQTMRYLEGDRDCMWKSATGRKPRRSIDWELIPVRGRGGGQGEGAVHCHVDFLKHVFLTQLHT
jgi:hypothetical protein